MNTDFWNDRYGTGELVYGDAPNDFLAQMRDRMPASGKVIDLGAGQGRNALYLASLGLDVLAVDQSDVGLRTAQRLADERGLALRTRAADLRNFDVEPGSVDLVTSIFVHLPPALRTPLHDRIQQWLRPRGVFVLEAFAPEQIARSTGGPRDPDRFAPLETYLDELRGLTVEHAATLVRVVREGRFHTGHANVVQILGRKQ